MLRIGDMLVIQTGYDDEFNSNNDSGQNEVDSEPLKIEFGDSLAATNREKEKSRSPQGCSLASGMNYNGDC